jgi:hypothetical protein
LPLVTGALLVAQTPTVAAGQIAAGYINDFEDGTTQGWVTNLLGFGSVPPELVPANVSSGGPSGVDDNYLRLVSIGGSLPGGKLVAINPLNWGGNYLAAGITEIRFDAINLGASDISLRFLLEDPTGSPPTNIAVTSAAATLFAGGGWQAVVLPLFGAGGLVPFLGTVEGALTNATTARIYHSSLATFPGEPTVATLGIDNIRAVGAVAAVPEPTTAVLLTVAVVMFALMRSPGRGRLRLH